MIRLQNYIDGDILLRECSKLHNHHHERLLSAMQIRDRILSVQNEILSSLLLQRQQESGAAVEKDDNCVALYPRRWMALKTESRPSVTSSMTTPVSFTAGQFNMLARGLSSGPSSLFPRPFPASPSNSNADQSANRVSSTVASKESAHLYGGLIGVAQPEIVLDFDRVRKWRLLQVLLGGGIAVDDPHNDERYDEPAFDILALEEVDEYESFFRPLLVVRDPLEKAPFPWYHGAFEPKPLSPCVRYGFYSDGVALLWNHAKFDTVPAPPQWRNNQEKRNNSMEDEEGDEKGTEEPWIVKGTYTQPSTDNQVYIIVPLRIRPNVTNHDSNSNNDNNVNKPQQFENYIIVGATHLKAKKGMINESIRTKQALELRQRMECIARVLMDSSCDNSYSNHANDNHHYDSNGETMICHEKSIHMLLLGDFNSEPKDSSIASSILKHHDSSMTTSKHRNFKWQFQSAYPIQTEKNNETSNIDHNNNNLKMERDNANFHSTNSLHYTTWKTRKDGTVRRIIDYIFYSSSSPCRNSHDNQNKPMQHQNQKIIPQQYSQQTHAPPLQSQFIFEQQKQKQTHPPQTQQQKLESSQGLHCTHILSIPQTNDIEEGLLPGIRYPSDHLLIGAKFCISS